MQIEYLGNRKLLESRKVRKKSKEGGYCPKDSVTCYNAGWYCNRECESKGYFC